MHVESVTEQYPDLSPLLERYRAAMRGAMAELGVPGEGYPAPVANAYEILAEALGDEEPVGP